MSTLESTSSDPYSFHSSFLPYSSPCLIFRLDVCVCALRAQDTRNDVTMQQWVTKHDGLDKLRLVDVPEPSRLKEGEVLVKIHSVSLNFRDTEGK